MTKIHVFYFLILSSYVRFPELLQKERKRQSHSKTLKVHYVLSVSSLFRVIFFNEIFKLVLYVITNDLERIRRPGDCFMFSKFLKKEKGEFDGDSDS